MAFELFNTYVATDDISAFCACTCSGQHIAGQHVAGDDICIAAGTEFVYVNNNPPYRIPNWNPTLIRFERVFSSHLYFEFDDPVLATILPKFEPHMVKGRKYECIKDYPLPILLKGSFYQCENVGVGADKLLQYNMHSGLLFQGISHSKITKYFKCDGMTAPTQSRDISIVTTELYDAYSKGQPTNKLLEEFKAISGKDKPGFMF